MSEPRTAITSCQPGQQPGPERRPEQQPGLRQQPGSSRSSSLRGFFLLATNEDGKERGQDQNLLHV